VSTSVAELLQYLPGQWKDCGSNSDSAISLEYIGVLGLISWVDMARYSLFVLKVPLNTNEPANVMLL